MRRLIASVMVASLVGCTAGQAASASSSADIESVNRVPDSLPSEGVSVREDFVVVPDLAAAVSVSREQAIAVAEQASTVPESVVTTHLGRVTVPGSLAPPDASVPYDSVDRELCWIVGFEFPSAIDVHVGGTSPVYASRQYVIINATTAQMRRGFFEP